MKQLYDRCIKNGFEVLPISFEHTEKLEDLPYHHKDPFDRIIISQALIEDLFVITSDDNFKKYNIKYVG